LQGTTWPGENLLDRADLFRVYGLGEIGKGTVPRKYCISPISELAIVIYCLSSPNARGDGRR